MVFSMKSGCCTRKKYFAKANCQIQQEHWIMPNREFEETQIQILRFRCQSVFCVFRDGYIMISIPCIFSATWPVLICWYASCAHQRSLSEISDAKSTEKRTLHRFEWPIKWAHSSTYFSQSSFGSQLWITSDLLQKLVCFVSLASTGTCCHGQQVWHFNRCFCISGWLQGLQKLQGLANLFCSL